MSELPPAQRRGVRSFVRREGRMTAAQADALATLLPRFEFASPLRFAEHAFINQAPLALEIGCGNGDFLAHAAALAPDVNFIGAEVHRPGLGQLVRRAAQDELGNVRLYTQDVNLLIAELPPETLSKIFVFFPDPWPKSRHHKRRLLSGAFFTALKRVVARHGRLFIATDVADYAESIVAALGESGQWINLAQPADFSPRYKPRLLTRFEARGLAAGRRAFEFALGPRD